MALDRQVAQEQLDLGLRSLQIVPRLHLMKLNVAANPIAVAALGTDRVVLEAHHLAYLVQQLQLGVGHHRTPNPRWALLAKNNLA